MICWSCRKSKLDFYPKEIDNNIIIGHYQCSKCSFKSSMGLRPPFSFFKSFKYVALKSLLEKKK